MVADISFSVNTVILLGDPNDCSLHSHQITVIFPAKAFNYMETCHYLIFIVILFDISVTEENNSVITVALQLLNQDLAYMHSFNFCTIINVHIFPTFDFKCWKLWD